MSTFYFGSTGFTNKLVELSTGLLIYILVYLFLFIVKLRKMHYKDAIIYTLKFTYVCALLEVTIYPIPLTSEMIRYNFSKPIGGHVNYNPLVLFTLISEGNPIYFKHYFLNILMTVPAGFFIAEHKKTKSFFTTFFYVFVLSLSIELVQLLMRVFLGSSRDVDILDVLFNIIGGILGYASFRFYMRIKEKRKNGKGIEF